MTDEKTRAEAAEAECDKLKERVADFADRAEFNVTNQHEIEAGRSGIWSAIAKALREVVEKEND